jgi:N-carbamoylputrescine amidase
VKLGLVQIKGNCREKVNFEKLFSLIRNAAQSDIKIFALPELFLHDYFCITENQKHFSSAHTTGSEEMMQLQKLAKELEVVLIVPFFEKRDKGIYHNSAVVYDADGSNLGIFRKMHIPDDPGFFEKYYFTPGDLGFRSFKTRYGRIGILICWDQWFPEAARLTVLKGCDLLLSPSAIAWDTHELEGLTAEEQKIIKKEQLQAWKTIQKSHAIANGVFLAAVNRIGKEGHLEFWGNSFVCNTMGGELGSLNDKEEKVLIVDCDFKEIEETRNTWPFFRDRRVDSYDGLSKRFNT